MRKWLLRFCFIHSPWFLCSVVNWWTVLFFCSLSYYPSRLRAKNRESYCICLSNENLFPVFRDLSNGTWNQMFDLLCHFLGCRFQTVAYLQQTWWFEVDGEFEFRFPPGTYSLFFRLHLGRASKRLGRRVCNPEHIHGWDIKPVKFQLTTSEGQHAVSKCYLENPGNWIHHHVGDFVVEQSDTTMKIKFSATQIDCTHTKGGVCVDSVLICPWSIGKEVRQHL